MKHWYVRALRGVRSVLAATGLLRALDRWAARSRTGVWARSLLAIHDLDDMVALDVPWWTFEAGARVEEFLASRPGARVFEWGSGASTLWLARRAALVESVEHDEGWATWLAPRLPQHALLHVVPAVRAAAPRVTSNRRGHGGLDFAAYVGAVGDRGTFDLVVVDGRAREACLVRALEHLAPDGLLVLDNVDRERYRQALRSLGDAVEVETTRGLTPALPYPTRTALVRHATRTAGA